MRAHVLSESGSRLGYHLFPVLCILCLHAQTQQAMAIVEAMAQRGVHNIIKHADMSVFWRNNFTTLPEVKWDVFWGAFPDELVQNPWTAEQVGRYFVLLYDSDIFSTLCDSDKISCEAQLQLCMYAQPVC